MLSVILYSSYHLRIKNTQIAYSYKTVHLYGIFPQYMYRFVPARDVSTTLSALINRLISGS